MIGQLIKTEFRINRVIIILSLIGNAGFAVNSLLQGRDLVSFAAVSTLVFYLLVLAWSVASGEEKRGRYFAELPVTKAECFVAGWTFVLLLLLVHVAFWVLVATFSPQTDAAADASALLSGFLGICLALAVIGIWVDLWSYRPFYFHWIYLATVILTVNAVSYFKVWAPFLEHSDTHAGEGLNVYPIMFWPMSNEGTFLLALLVAGLLAVDYFVFTRADSFLS